MELCRGEGEHPFDVPSHGDQAPFASDLFEAAEQELAEAHDRFDDAEHRLRGLLAQGVELLALGVARRWHIAASGVGLSGAGGAWAKRSRQDRWWCSRAMAISGAILAASQAVTLAALK